MEKLQMRKFLIVIMVAVMLVGCGGNTNLYELETTELNINGVTFDIPKLWNDNLEETEDYNFYYSGDVIFNVETKNVNFTNNELLDEKDTWLSTFLEDDSFENSNIEIINIDNIQALERQSKLKASNVEYNYRDISFVSCGNLYIFRYYMDIISEDKYLDEYNSLKNSIEVFLPYDIETDEGTIQLSNIYIREEKTQHGYEGLIAFEFDLSALDENGRYWFEQNYNISIYDRSSLDINKKSIELNEFSEMQSPIQDNGKKYIFWFVQEQKNPLNESELHLDIDVWKEFPNRDKLEIERAASNFYIRNELPENIYSIFLDLFLEKHYDN